MMPSLELPSGKKFIVICCILIACIAASGFYYQAQRGLRGDDDNLWLYFYAAKITQYEKGNNLEGKVIALTKERHANPTATMRLEMRRDYGKNYILPVRIWNGLQGLFPPSSSVKEYPHYLSHFLSFMLAISTGLAWTTLLLALFYIRNRKLALSTVLGLTITAVLTLLPTSFPSMVLFDAPHFKDGLANAVRFALNPWYAMSIFGFTPRNNIMILVLAVFILRWNDNKRLPYLMLLPLYLVHSSYTLVFSMHMIALDVLLRRQTLRDPAILSAFFAGMIYGLWRETLWSSVGNINIILSVLFSLISVILLIIFLPNPFRRFGNSTDIFIRTVMKHYTKLTELPKPISDVALILIFWIITAPIFYLISLHMSADQNYYFWHQFHGRCIALFQAVIICGITFPLYPLLQKRKILYPLLVGLCFIWVIGFTFSLLKLPSPIVLTYKDLQATENFISKRIKRNQYPFLPPKDFIISESVVYYGLGQMLTIGNDRYKEIQETAEKPQ